MANLGAWAHLTMPAFSHGHSIYECQLSVYQGEAVSAFIYSFIHRIILVHLPILLNLDTPLEQTLAQIQSYIDNTINEHKLYSHRYTIHFFNTG